MKKAIIGVALAYGLFCAFSVLFWAFTGMTLWAPADGNENYGRAFVLTTLHLVGIGLLVIAVCNTLWGDL